MRLSFWTSSIGKKYAVAATGLALFGFVCAHMLGNLQIFLGREALNSYAEHLMSLPALLWPARAVLLTCLVVHVALAVRLSIENRTARPVAYAVRRSPASTPPSRTMLWSGAAVFFFIVYHLLHFTFGAVHPEFHGLKDPSGRHDVYSMVVASFRHPGIAASYVAGMVFLCLHLSHGVGSLFQTLGASDDRLRRFWRPVSMAAAAVIFIGNTSIVAACFFGWVPLPGRSA